ncbi:hypothetical protein ACVILH_005843 [Bradyrhizobium sp. USDA 4353]
MMSFVSPSDTRHLHTNAAPPLPVLHGERGQLTYFTIRTAPLAALLAKAA